MDIDGQHQPDANVQHHHRAAARRIEGQRDADNGQDAQVHAHIDRDLGHQRTADARADEGAQQVLAPRPGQERPDDDGEQHPQHHAAAHKARRVADPAEDEVVVGVGHAVVAAAEHPVAKDAAAAQRDLAALLLVDDVLPDGLAGSPAGLVFGVHHGEDAVPLVALADLIAEKGEGRSHSRPCRRQRPDDIPPAQPRRKHHAAADDGVDDGRAVITLHMDDEDGGRQMEQQLAQLLRLVDAAPHIVQVHREGQDEADLGQLRGL